MARPKHQDGEQTAYERIADAYWAELSEKPYEKITISSLAKRAGVNHNLLYYYFENIDEMAIRLFEENTSGQFSAQYFINAILQGENILPAIDQSALIKMQRVRLYVRGDSAYLSGIFQNAVLKTWLEGTGKAWEDLSFEDRFDLRFVIGGLISILSASELSDTPSKLMSFTNREIGTAAKSTLNRIRSRNTSST